MTIEIPEADRIGIDATSPTLAVDVLGALLAYGLVTLLPSRFTVVGVHRRVVSEPGIDMIEVTTASPHGLTNDDAVSLECGPYHVPAAYVIRSDDFGNLDSEPRKFWLPVPYATDAAGGSWARV